jgi:hypothetical protein
MSIDNINALKPGVDKIWLFVIAAVMWSGVGIYLDYLASGWLRPLNLAPATLFIVSGMLLAAGIYFVMFRSFADQNIMRINGLNGEKICIFAFQRWTSYPLVLVMISLGVILRHYSPIPEPYLAILYLGVGSSLFLASLRYYRYLSNVISEDKRDQRNQTD